MDRDEIQTESQLETGAVTNWESVIGQKQLIQNLKNSLLHQKISHAYMLQGEKLSGKKMVADLFARALQCESETERPCNKCRSCKQAIGRNHPDIVYISHEKPNVISVDNIREQLNGDIAIKPYSGPYKIYIMDEAEKMNQQAQNALLKTLEEPPEYAVILLLASNVEMMLQTILSRCVVMNMKAVSNEEIKSYLMEKVQVPDYLANVCASFARGNVGRAISLASHEDFDQMKNDVLSIVKNIEKIEFHQISSAVKEIEEKKYDVNDYLDLCMIWYRDLLLMKAGNDTKHIIFSEEAFDLRRQSQKYSYEGIERIIHEIEHARSRYKSNVNFQLTMEMLFLEMQNNSKSA